MTILPKCKHPLLFGLIIKWQNWTFILNLSDFFSLKNKSLGALFFSNKTDFELMKIDFHWKCFVGSLWHSCFINCILNDFFKLAIRVELLNTENALPLFLWWIFWWIFWQFFFLTNFSDKYFDEFLTNHLPIFWRFFLQIFWCIFWRLFWTLLWWNSLTNFLSKFYTILFYL